MLTGLDKSAILFSWFFQKALGRVSGRCREDETEPCFILPATGKTPTLPKVGKPLLALVFENMCG